MEEDLNKVTDKAVYFYTPRFYALDNFAAYTVSIWGKEFSTGEHAYQWKKFSNSHPHIAEEIYGAKNPNIVKKLSDSLKAEVPAAWHDTKAQIMEEILRAKLKQHEKIGKLLLESGDRDIIENSPTDSYWGIADGTGQNMLGKLWMKLRDELKTANDKL